MRRNPHRILSAISSTGVLSGAPKADTFICMNAALYEVEAGRKEGGDVLGVHISQLHPQVLYFGREVYLLRRIVNGQHPATKQSTSQCFVAVIEPARAFPFEVGHGHSRLQSSQARISLVVEKETFDICASLRGPSRSCRDRSCTCYLGSPEASVAAHVARPLRCHACRIASWDGLI